MRPIVRLLGAVVVPMASLALFDCSAPPADSPPSDATVEAGDAGSSDVERSEASKDRDAGDSVPPDPAGTVVVDRCIGMSGVAEPCTLVTNASACTPTARCSKLVVVFSGGEQGCINQPGYAKVMAGYASKGYAAVCINYFATSAGAGAVPYIDEADRIDLAVKEATTGLWARTYWTGEHLLLEGISHGATAPLILMARTTLDDQQHWKGRSYTAGCFFDGSYDQVASANLLRTGGAGGQPCTAPVPYSRWLERYCGAGASESSCDLATLPKAQLDTIVPPPADSFAVDDFKMFECGSSLPACAGDVLPAEPISRLCTDIAGARGHSCSFVSLPKESHLTCHQTHFDDCRVWFDSRVGN